MKPPIFLYFGALSSYRKQKSQWFCE